MRLEKNKTHLRLSKRKSTLIDQKKIDKHTYKNISMNIMYTLYLYTL